jgi:hypothetical protein
MGNRTSSFIKWPAANSSIVNKMFESIRYITITTANI